MRWDGVEREKKREGDTTEKIESLIVFFCVLYVFFCLFFSTKGDRKGDF